MAKTTPFLPGLSPVADKPLTVQRNAGNLTSNRSLMVARRLDIAHRVARHIPDGSDPLPVTHTFADMVLACAMMIAGGHKDCDDIDTLKSDSTFKMAYSRAPETGLGLMSQPTLSTRPRAWTI